MTALNGRGYGRQVLIATALAAAALTFSYGDERPAPPALVQLAQGPARSFWRDRNVLGCDDGITVYQSSLVGEIGWGAGGNCTVWLSDDLVGVLEPDRFGRNELIDACQAVTHEVGHALGLPHTPTGVMAVSGQPPTPHGWAPWFCRTWAKREVVTLLRANHELSGKQHESR